MVRDLEYEKNNKINDYIKCKNYELCNATLPNWWYECKGNYLCINCHMLFGTWGSGVNRHTGKGILPISDNLECPICLNIKRAISQPNCEHTVCIDCFKRCQYDSEQTNLKCCPLCRK